MPHGSQRLALLITCTLLLAASCAVPPPRSGETTPLRWSTSGPDLVDVAYGPEPEHLARIHLPTAGGNRGVIITVHGGGFTEGSPDMVEDWFGPVMRQTTRGFAVVNVAYRLASASGNHFPVGVQDVSTAVRWVREQGRSHGLEPRTVIVAGHSAGGTIAALLGTASNSSPSGPLGRTAAVDGWLSFAGIYDFTTDDRKIRPLARTWLGPQASQRRRLESASAVRHLDRRDPPGFVVHGDLDGIVPASQLHVLLAAAGRAGVTARLFWDSVGAGRPFHCRNHLPQCGMNASVLDDWVIRVAARTL